MPPDALAAQAPALPRSRRARPPSSWVVGWFGLALAVIPVLSLAMLGWMQYRTLYEAETNRLELLATVLEDHATRTVDATANTLSALADQLVSPQQQESPELITPMLVHSMASLPALRGMAVVDLHGVILGSTIPVEVGMQIDLSRLGPLPDVGKDGLGNLVQGSGLMRLSRDTATMQGTSGVAFIPLMRHVRMNTGQGLLLVGLLNPDSFAGYQQLTVKDEHTAALLTSYDGMVLATLPWVAVDPGTRLLQHPLFSDFGLQQRDHGGFEGAGARPGDQLTAYRVSRTRPLVMLVEQPKRILLKDWWDRLIPPLLVRLLMVAGTLAMTAYAVRTLRRYEAMERGQETVREAVASRERELGELFKLVPELIFRTDKDGVINFMNARYADVSGRPTELALGRALADLVLPGSRDAVQTLFEPNRGRAPRRGQAVVEGTYGIERRFDITVMPLYDGDVLRAFAGSAVDLTERLMLQDKLRGQVEFTGRLLELCPVPVSIVDRDGHYLTVNKAWEQFSMRNRNEVLGRSPGEHWDAAESAQHRHRDSELIEVGGSQSYEALVTRIDQSRRLVRVAKVAIPGEDGKPVAILNTFSDLTEFRDAERATEQAREAAEQASRVKSEFIASVSHELRTPLQAILGFSEIGLARELTRERQLALFNEIHSSGRGMLLMVNDLLDLAKIEGSGPPGERPVTDLREAVDAVHRELSPLLAPKLLELRLSLGDRPLPVRIDPLRCQQLLRNLLANAIKVSPAGGLIEVAGTLAGSAAGALVQLRVRDQGPGIPEAELHRIFDPFVQSSFTKGQPGAGTGLGLAICRKIVGACGGTLQALNRPEGGASFELLLPQAEIPPVAAVPKLALVRT